MTKNGLTCYSACRTTFSRNNLQEWFFALLHQSLTWLLERWPTVIYNIALIPWCMWVFVFDSFKVQRISIKLTLTRLGVSNSSPWRWCLGRGRSGTLCLDCCPHDPTSDKADEELNWAYFLLTNLILKRKPNELRNNTLSGFPGSVIIELLRDAFLCRTTKM